MQVFIGDGETEVEGWASVNDGLREARFSKNAALREVNRIQRISAWQADKISSGTSGMPSAIFSKKTWRIPPALRCLSFVLAVRGPTNKRHSRAFHSPVATPRSSELLKLRRRRERCAPSYTLFIPSREPRPSQRTPVSDPARSPSAPCPRCGRPTPAS